MNYGPTKQKVMLAVGRAGQKIGVLSPILDPKRQLFFGKPAAKSLDRISPRRMGASSQVVNADGLARLWVDPMSIRVVLVYDE